MNLCQFFGWQYPLVTAKYLALIVTALLAVKVNLATYFFNLVYLGLLAAAAAEYAGQFLTGEGFVTKYFGAPQSCATCVRESLLPALADTYECLERKVLSIVFVNDLEKTLKVAGIAFILHKITAYISLYALIWIGVAFIFSVPPLYQAYQNEVDAAFSKYTKVAKAQIQEKVGCAKSKLCPLVQQLIEKTGPVGAFVKLKIPTRTAGSTVGHSSIPKTISEPTTGFTSGASKFPEVPATEIKSSVTEVEEKTENSGF
ncbi:hypothetical protein METBISCDRAFT_14480 [Metschnikowia bicuspidata]|uniref:Reticulon-like protein n=1 Tax=Metschnikowia bicuspidata TaxID=27322 RepID=A0A4P9ZE69_9ASCO|nr:hypothetical protein METBISCDRAFT_14480 [Metschnikowia bicuspidata]